jgi:hypothetical protein
MAGGDEGVIRDVFWKENEPWLVLPLPSGVRTAIPMSWTDLPVEYLPTTDESLEAQASSLAELARYCRSLRRRTRHKKSMPT